MANYILDMTKAHRTSFIELVNHDNAATVGEPLTLANTLLQGEAAVVPEDNVQREFKVTLVNAGYAPDTVEVFWNKVKLEDVMEMIISEGADNDFDWYKPDTWDDDTSPADAIAAFKSAAIRDGIDPEAALEGLTVTRIFNAEENRYYLEYSLTSMVFHSTALFRMPRHFSEEITVTNLNGFVYSPIQPEDVVE